MVWIDLLKNPLQFAASGVVLLTTRDKTVASGVGAIYVHEVEKLSRRSCWELLCKKAYIGEEDDMLNLRDVGMEIVKKCDGLPLAIKVIGGLLATKKKDRREWEKVLQSNAWIKGETSEELHKGIMD
ncbi:Resistance protein [Rhynchospora pubera]|uniref:Resistance protein n=1 Tax=Rhynchospora pubera TaxID=906938 RepID=A0AAV8H822_9POAL|nr:Resistance protein [Rhynchospora pubera]